MTPTPAPIEGHAHRGTTNAAGLPPELARKATAQVFVGTGRLLADTERSLPELNGMIGLHTLSEAAAKQLFADAYKGSIRQAQGFGRTHGRRGIGQDTAFTQL